MIYDKLTNLHMYKGISPNLDTAIAYLNTHDPSALPMGRTEVAGSQVYINVMDAAAAPEAERGYEIHKNYMDIQIDLSGTEIIEIGDGAAMKVLDYNEETDFGRAECPTLTSCIMGPGNFIVCMANEPHKPGIAAGENRTLKKCVVKVHR